MKCLVISRPITNGGDYLIVKKLLEVLKNELPKYEVIFNDGSTLLTLDYLNSFDRLIIGGGPIYENRIFNYSSFPLLTNLSDVKVPIYIIGSGWFGKNGDMDSILKYKFNEEAISVFDKVIASGGFLSGRDYVTTRVLKNHGYNNAIMTGCPVWYDYDYIGNADINKNVNKTIKKIIISDPGITKEIDEQKIKSKQTIEVIEFIRARFPSSVIEFTFNNGIYTKYSTKCNVEIMNYLEENGIKYHDLSNDWEGFNVYNDIDLHVGYRVHSHIYTLSKRIPSILIEEDARGFGVNHALALETNIPSCIFDDYLSNIQPNPYLIEHLSKVIEEMIETDFLRIKNAFNIMNESYKVMQKALLKI